VQFSSYNSLGVRALSGAYADALGYARLVLPRKLSTEEDTLLGERLTQNLMDAHDSGERDPGALRRAALRGVLVSGRPA
jgi:hypothetical protein